MPKRPKSTYSLDLEFESSFPLKEGDIPGGATANISVKQYSHAEEGGRPLLTPDCITIKELEFQIDRLQEELEIIRSKAKAKFSRHDELEEEWVKKSKD